MRNSNQKYRRLTHVLYPLFSKDVQNMETQGKGPPKRIQIQNTPQPATRRRTKIARSGVRRCEAPHPRPIASMSKASMKPSGPFWTENVTEAPSAKCTCHETGTRIQPNAARPNSASALDSTKPQPPGPGGTKRRPRNRR